MVSLKEKTENNQSYLVIRFELLLWLVEEDCSGFDLSQQE